MDTQHNWWQNVRRNKAYRRKFFRTLSIIFCSASLGFFFGNLGPALPDIQLLTGKGLDDVSWLFTATNAGSLLGTLVCGQIVDRVGPQLVLFVSLLTASVLTAVFIYCPSFTAMLVVRGFTGIFVGCVDLAGIAAVTELWHAEARPYIHSLQVMLSTGGILTPLVIEPFLAPRMKRSEIDNGQSLSFTSDRHNDSVLVRIDDLNKTDSAKIVNYSIVPHTYYLHRNATYMLENVIPPTGTNVSFSNENSLGTNGTLLQSSGYESTIAIGRTQIHYAFIIFAAIGISAAICLLTFIVSDCIGNNLKKSEKSSFSNIEKKHSNRLKYMLPKKMKMILLGILTVQFYLVAAMCFKCYAFMPTFFILQFDWSVTLASLAMSLFWIGRTIVGIIGIYLVTRFKQSLLVAGFSSIYLASSVSLTISSISHINELAWVSTALLGIGFSILFPSLFALTEENITHVTGRLGSVFMGSFVTGGMLDPLYTGYLMDRVSPMWFAYLLVLQSFAFLLLFIVVKVVIWRYGQRQNTGMEIEIEPMKN